MTDIANIIREAWGWCGAEAVELIATNAFGNVIFQDSVGNIWRICPEELSAANIAPSRLEYEALRVQPGFATDWNMEKLKAEAEALLGEPGEGRCYCLKIPAVLGGRYVADNLGTISLSELLRSSGAVAFQIKDLPNGSKVRLVVKKPN